MSWAKLVSGVISLLNRLSAIFEANQHRADGARRNELEHRDKQDEVKRKANADWDVVRDDNVDDIIERMRKLGGDKGKGRN